MNTDRRFRLDDPAPNVGDVVAYDGEHYRNAPSGGGGLLAESWAEVFRSADVAAGESWIEWSAPEGSIVGGDLEIDPEDPTLLNVLTDGAYDLVLYVQMEPDPEATGTVQLVTATINDPDVNGQANWFEAATDVDAPAASRGFAFSAGAAWRHAGQSIRTKVRAPTTGDVLITYANLQVTRLAAPVVAPMSATAPSWGLYGLDGGSYVLSGSGVFVPWQEFDLVGSDIELDPDGHTIRILTAGLYGALAWMDLLPSAGNADGAVYCYYGGLGPWLSQSKTEIVPVRPTAASSDRGITVPLPLAPCWCAEGDTLNVTAQTAMAVGTVTLSDSSTVLQITRLA